MLVYQRVPTVLGDSPWPMSSTYFVATLLFHWPADINGLQINDRGQKRQVFFGLKSSTGWWLTYPSEKYESQLGWLFPIYGKIKNVPNHQPVNESSCENTPHVPHSTFFGHVLKRFWNDALKVAFSSAVFRGRLKHPQSAAWQLWDTLGNFKSSLIYSSSPMVDLLGFLYPIINLSIACWAWHQLTHWLHPGWKITSNQQVKHRNVWWYFIAIVVHQSVFV